MARAWLLDLDHLGTQIGEHLTGQGASQHPAHVNNANTVQLTHCLASTHSLSARSRRAFFDEGSFNPTEALVKCYSYMRL
jgi:hypothetical protein